MGKMKVEAFYGIGLVEAAMGSYFMHAGTGLETSESTLSLPAMDLDLMCCMTLKISCDRSVLIIIIIQKLGRGAYIPPSYAYFPCYYFLCRLTCLHYTIADPCACEL
jgi:hypothetical protein